MKISELSIRRPIYITVLFVVIGILGIMGYRSLNAELMPKFTPPSINIQIVYPGASPVEVENSLTRKVEDAVSGLEGIESMHSYSFEGMSMVFVTLSYKTDIDKAIADAQNKIDAKRMELPPTILSPMINKISMDDRSIITLSATSSHEATEFYDLIDKRVIPELLRIEGVSKAIAVGGQQREIEINLDMERMRAYGLQPIQIQGILRSSNLDFPTGSLRNDKSNTVVRLSGKLSDVEQIRDLVITTLTDGTQIRMNDVAEVIDTAKDANRLARIDGHDAVLINIFKQSDANAIEISNSIARCTAQLENDYKADNLKMEITNDTSNFTRDSINSVLVDLLMAIILVAAVILLFMHNLRNALIVMIVVPVSLIGTFIGMQLFHFTLNLMSLLGMSVVIGVLVDDAIVVIENIYRHMEMGKNAVRASKDAMKEIGSTVISITLVLVIVFLPIALTNTLVSDILRQFCGVIIFSILFSLLAALTLIPLLTSRFGKLSKLNSKNIFDRFFGWFERIIKQFSEWIARLLEWSLGHKGWVATIVIALTVVVVLLFPLGFIGFQFMPDVDQSEFSITLEMPKENSIEQSAALVTKAEQWLMKQNEVKQLITTIGMTGEERESTQGMAYMAQITVKMVPSKQRKMDVERYIAQIREPLTDYLVDAKISLYSKKIHGTGNSAAVDYIITGNNADSVDWYASRALDIMRSIEGTMQQQLSSQNGTPQINVEVDRDKMSALGLTLDNVGLTMQLAFQGNNSIKFVQNDYQYDINIRAQSNYRNNIDDVSSLTFINQRGEPIRMDQFATIGLGTGPNRLERYNRNRSVNVSTQVLGVSAGHVSNLFKQQFDELNHNGTVYLESSGDMKSMGDSMGVLTGALLLSIVLMYLALVLLYNNWSDPLAVMFSIPFSILGAILALALSNTSLNIYAMLGLVMLVGLVAKNAILLVDFANELVRNGNSVNESLLSAVRLRTRPILMTALSTIIGMIPVAISKGSGAELRNGLGWVIIGGMTLSTLLTLIVVPVVYKILHRNQSSAKKSKNIEELMNNFD